MIFPGEKLMLCLWVKAVLNDDGDDDDDDDNDSGGGGGSSKLNLKRAFSFCNQTLLKGKILNIIVKRVN